MASPSSMAADPHHHRQNRFSLQLGDGLKNGSSSPQIFTSVRFNHKPRLSSGSRHTKLCPTSSKDGCILQITDTLEADKKSTYTYSGQQKRDSKGQYVLLFDHAKQTATLERLNASYDFNLESMPQESSKEKLRERYPPIPSLQKSTEEQNEPDPNNPFDYRHFLTRSKNLAPVDNDRGVSRSPSPLPQHTPKVHPASRLESPLPRFPISASSPARRSPMVRPAKSTDVLRPMNGKKRKLENNNSSRPSTPSHTQSKPQEHKPTPSVRLERRASTRPTANGKGSTTAKTTKVPLSSEYINSSDDEDSPPLASTRPQATSSRPAATTTSSHLTEIDLSASPPPKPPVQNHRKILGAVFGTPTQGPISLRSAANSPNPRGSPLHVGAKRRKSGPAEIDFGSDIEASQKSRLRAAPAIDQDEDEDAEGDEDVVPMSLGSPAHGDSGRPKSLADIAGSAGGDGDTDAGVDDFEAEMMQGFFDDGPGNAAPTAQEEESDVSEAE